MTGSCLLSTHLFSLLKLFEHVVSQRVVATDGATGDVPGTWQLPESPSIDWLFLPSSQSKGSLLSLLWHLESQWKTHVAEVVLGDTLNPSLGEKGPLGSENNDCFFLSTPYSFARSLSFSLSRACVHVTCLGCTHCSLASKSRSQGVVAGLHLSPAQWCTPNTPH